jgi:hypothetical protein
MAMADLARTDEYDPFDAEKFANPAVAGAIGSLATLPQRAIQNSQFAVNTGVYDPAVPVEAAMTVMGGSAVPRVPVKAGEVAVGSGPIRAYHSSPHDFDRFDLSKIGTGEGAQAYGHGLYFAENPAVSGQGGQYWNQFLRRFEGPEAQAAELLKKGGFNRAQTAEELQAAIDGLVKAHPDNAAMYAPMLDKWQKQLDVLQSGKPVGPRTYEVNINADPAHMLDWDKQLGQQPEVTRAALERLGVKSDRAATGEKIYSDLIDQTGMTRDRVRASQAERSAMLNEAGIPGIKYLDGGSRNAVYSSLENDVNFARQRLANFQKANLPDQVVVAQKDLENRIAALNTVPKPSSNYVVFDPSIVNIMKKYGIAGAAPAGMGALAATGNYQPEERN